MPPAPLRLSITIGWPSFSATCAPTGRPNASSGLPGAVGTIQVIGLSGQAAARAGIARDAPPARRAGNVDRSSWSLQLARRPPWQWRSSADFPVDEAAEVGAAFGLDLGPLLGPDALHLVAARAFCTAACMRSRIAAGVAPARTGRTTRGAEVLQPCLVDRRHVGQQRLATAAGDAERAQLARFMWAPRRPADTSPRSGRSAGPATPARRRDTARDAARCRHGSAAARCEMRHRAEAGRRPSRSSLAFSCRATSMNCASESTSTCSGLITSADGAREGADRREIAREIEARLGIDRSARRCAGAADQHRVTVGGRARAFAAPTVPPAPPRLSITIVWPSVAVAFARPDARRHRSVHRPGTARSRDVSPATRRLGRRLATAVAQGAKETRRVDRASSPSAASAARAMRCQRSTSWPTNGEVSTLSGSTLAPCSAHRRLIWSAPARSARPRACGR